MAAIRETWRTEELDYKEMLRERDDRAKGSFFRCGECGTLDGVECWTRGQLDEIEERGPISFQLYRDVRHEQDTGHCLFSLCPHCSTEVPDWLEPMTDEMAEAWRAEGCWCERCVPF